MMSQVGRSNGMISPQYAKINRRYPSTEQIREEVNSAVTCNLIYLLSPRVVTATRKYHIKTIGYYFAILLDRQAPDTTFSKSPRIKLARARRVLMTIQALVVGSMCSSWPPVAAFLI